MNSNMADDTIITGITNLDTLGLESLIDISGERHQKLFNFKSGYVGFKDIIGMRKFRESLASAFKTEEAEDESKKIFLGVIKNPETYCGIPIKLQFPTSRLYPFVSLFNPMHKTLVLNNGLDITYWKGVDSRFVFLVHYNERYDEFKRRISGIDVPPQFRHLL